MTNPSNAAARFRTMQRLFDHYLDLDTRQRADELQALAQDHATMAGELDGLLAAVDPNDLLPPNEPVIQGRRVGAFALVRVLGTGGMGDVFLAERVDGGFEQQVAIKLVRQTGLSTELHRHFLRERQLLAHLQHPNIAHLIDGGLTETGQPWLAMEYVDGVTLMRHVRAKQLDVGARLRLWLKVAEAVEHAHRRLIVHRDLKPANVMVNAAGVPKLIDFGVAGMLATDSDPGASQHGYTPRYAAPEQIAGEPVTTATDVYGLGMLLFELLSGVPAFRESSDLGLRQAILFEDAPSLGGAAREAIAQLNAATKQEDPGEQAYLAYVQGFDHELDVILHKALRKIPAERYASAQAFADDVERHLRGEAIVAMPSSRWYRARKFLGRHRAAVLGVATVFVVLVGGIMSVAWQTRIAQQRAAELEQVSKFQADMLAQVDPTQAGKMLRDDETAMFEKALHKAGASPAEHAAQMQAFTNQRQQVNATDAARNLIDNTILKPAVAAIDRQFKDQPIFDAALRQVLADRYFGLGLYDAALPLQERALATRRRVLGEEHPDTLTSIEHMGFLLQAQGSLSDAEPYLRKALEGRRRVLGEGRPDTLTSVDHMAVLLEAQGKLTEAESLYREALEKRRQVLGEEHVDTLESINNLGGLLLAQGKLSEAERYYREALDKHRRVRGEEHPITLTSINNLAVLLQSQGQLGEAEPYYREALEKRRRVLGEEHPDTLLSINNLGFLLRFKGQLSEAESYFHESFEIRRRALGKEHPDTLVSLNNLGVLLLDEGKLADAEAYLREAAQTRRRVLGEQHPATLISLNNLGSLLVIQGKHVEAAELLAPAEAATRAAFTAANAYRTSRFLMNLGKARAGLGQFGAAEANLVEAHASFVRSPGPKPEDMRECTKAIVDLYTAWHAREPGKGHDASATQWQRKLKDLDATGSASKAG